MTKTIEGAISRLSADECLRYRHQLESFYHSNIRDCSFMESFSSEDCSLKISSLINHVANNSAVVFGYILNGNLEGYIWAYEHPFREEKRMYVSELFVNHAFRGGGYRKISA